MIPIVRSFITSLRSHHFLYHRRTLNQITSISHFQNRLLMAPKRSRSTAASAAGPGKEGTKVEIDETNTGEPSPRRRRVSQNGTKEGSASPTKSKSLPIKTAANGQNKKEKIETDQVIVEGETESLSAPEPKSKTNYETAEGIPRNMTIPDPLELNAKPPGSSRIASWNIISLKSSMTKGLLRYIEAEDADVMFLSETKCNDVPMVPALKEKYPFQSWGIGKTKGYAGVAMLSKQKPMKTIIGLPNASVDQDTKARIITVEFEHYIICGTYVVNAGEKLKSLPAKVRWNQQFSAHLAECDTRKPTIWTGDLNVVLDARDLSKASEKWNKSAGYTAVECNHHRKVLTGTAVEGAKPYVDIWRERNPDAIGHFTYYGFRGQCRQKGIGWRLDSFIIPDRIKDSVIDVGIRHSVYGASDHVPIYLDIKGPL